MKRKKYYLPSFLRSFSTSCLCVVPSDCGLIRWGLWFDGLEFVRVVRFCVLRVQVLLVRSRLPVSLIILVKCWLCFELCCAQVFVWWDCEDYSEIYTIMAMNCSLVSGSFCRFFIVQFRSWVWLFFRPFFWLCLQVFIVTCLDLGFVKECRKSASGLEWKLCLSVSMCWVCGTDETHELIWIGTAGAWQFWGLGCVLWFVWRNKRNKIKKWRKDNYSHLFE